MKPNIIENGLYYAVCIMFILLTIAAASGATISKTYYLENNGTIQSVGADGDTNYNVSGSTITVIPYKNLFKNGTMGSQSNIRYSIPNAGIQYEVFRFYHPFNYTIDTQISANTRGNIVWRAMSNSDTINISLLDYNPTNGAKTMIGSTQFATTGGGTTTTYSFTIPNSNYTVQSGNRLMLRINTTTTSTGSVRLYFNNYNSNITINETSIAVAPPNITSWGNSKTNNRSTSISINTSESVRFNVTANQTITAWNWFKDNVSQLNNYDNFTTSWSMPGIYSVNVNATNANGTSNMVTWSIDVKDTTPPSSVSNPSAATGNFFINNTWVNPPDSDFNYTWFRYSNGTTLQNVSKPANYLNLTRVPHYTQNISAQTIDTSGNINQTKVWFNATIPNNPPVQQPIGNKIVNESQLLQFAVTSTDIDSDVIIYGSNASKGTFNVTTGQFSWTPGYGDAGVYVWYFNSSDSYSSVANETITVTVNTGTSNDCIGCHSSQQGIYPAIVQAPFGKHKNVNSTGGQDFLNKSDCITCHYDISNMTQPGFSTGVLTCTDCHTQGNFSAPIIKNHRPPTLLPSPGAKITTTAYCSTCHNNSINQFAYSANASVGHYGTNASLIGPTVNLTPMLMLGFFTQEEASAYNKECNNCHNPSNPSYGDATLITVAHTSLGACNQCHLNTDGNNLHNGSLGMPVTFSCKECHTTYADRYKAPNLTNTNHKGYDCTYTCHVPTDYGTAGRFDSADHNTDWRFAPGNPPITDTVYLNGTTVLAVSKGNTVTITSRIRDYIYLASRVRGAEYYIDSDPGLGKGTLMDAVDGQYDAVNGAWENITGSIDTANMTLGTHTVYVRSMDIGKQWSSRVAAALVIEQPKGFLNGTVNDSLSGLGIIGVTVTTNTSVSAVTDSTGFYSLNLPNGTYTLTATKEPEYYPNTTIPPVTVTAFTTVTRDIIMTKKPTGTISGVVTN